MYILSICQPDLFANSLLSEGNLTSQALISTIRMSEKVEVGSAGNTSVDPLFDILLSELPYHIQTLINTSNNQTTESALSVLPTLRSSNLSTITSPETEFELEKEQGAITQQLQEIAQASYPKFISGSAALSSFNEQFGTFKKTAQEFYESEFSYLDNDIQHFSTLLPLDANDSLDSGKASEGTSARSGNAESIVLLKNLDKIQEMLELPTLTLACVNNGYYTEALDLASHANRLLLRFNNIKVIKDIHTQVEAALKTMLVQLLRLLRETVKLPTLIKVMSYLRRMQPFQSAPDVNRQLQQLYLVSRLQYIRTLLSTLDPLKRQSPEVYLKRTIEVFREHVFVTVVGFRSVFPESLSTSTSAPNGTGSSGSAHEKSGASSAGERLISSFLRTLVDELHQTITEISPFIADETARSSLWLQVSYCSQSLGRVGGDFWPTIQGPTEEGSSGITKEEWTTALRKQKEVTRHLGASAASPLIA